MDFFDGDICEYGEYGGDESEQDDEEDLWEDLGWQFTFKTEPEPCYSCNYPEDKLFLQYHLSTGVFVCVSCLRKVGLHDMDQLDEMQQTSDEYALSLRRKKDGTATTVTATAAPNITSIPTINNIENDENNFSASNITLSATINNSNNDDIIYNSTLPPPPPELSHYKPTATCEYAVINNELLSLADLSPFISDVGNEVIDEPLDGDMFSNKNNKNSLTRPEQTILYVNGSRPEKPVSIDVLLFSGRDGLSTAVLPKEKDIKKCTIGIAAAVLLSKESKKDIGLEIALGVSKENDGKKDIIDVADALLISNAPSTETDIKIDDDGLESTLSVKMSKNVIIFGGLIVWILTWCCIYYILGDGLDDLAIGDLMGDRLSKISGLCGLYGVATDELFDGEFSIGLGESCDIFYEDVLYFEKWFDRDKNGYGMYDKGPRERDKIIQKRGSEKSGIDPRDRDKVVGSDMVDTASTTNGVPLINIISTNSQLNYQLVLVCGHQNFNLSYNAATHTDNVVFFDMRFIFGYDFVFYNEVNISWYKLKEHHG